MRDGDNADMGVADAADADGFDTEQPTQAEEALESVVVAELRDPGRVCLEVRGRTSVTHFRER